MFDRKGVYVPTCSGIDASPPQEHEFSTMVVVVVIGLSYPQPFDLLPIQYQCMDT
jgi:hypothetical protein